MSAHVAWSTKKQTQNKYRYENKEYIITIVQRNTVKGREAKKKQSQAWHKSPKGRKKGRKEERKEDEKKTC